MGLSSAYHGTLHEIRFMRSLSARRRLTRLQVLLKYRDAAAKRANWGSIDAGELLHATDREIAAEVRKSSRKTA